ncbi:YLP motif-containing protein 1-like isoform X2 [Aricia agestis]|uniref:YLP motif-containing protein 1-like isoform X2 n=1 Tax=Aricia agestis TaxID=91739 RepID=UPI001C208FA4|nr:YLP motif-containing protein 1-like isoform X2 [Aricia agestis]
MAWPVPPGQWNSAVPMAAGADMSMGSYTPEQWTMMQQQSWQWAQWQQQYAQWQNQYGDKYNQQLQGMQAMGLAPPLPSANVPPPAPPPPDKPPPPPHENDEPLFSKPKGPEPVPAPNTNYGSSNDRNNYQKMPSEDKKMQPVTNTEALKKLAEEERVFDIQFQKWEEEIEKWKAENVNHPDKRAYSEYEQKFEACRAQLMERREQMKLKRDRLLGNIPQSANNTIVGNKPTSNPPQQYNKSNNYSMSAPPVQHGYTNNSARPGNNRNMSQSQSQYNMPQRNFNRDNRNVNQQESYNNQYDLYNNHDSNNDYMQDDYGTVIEEDSNFLPSGASAKGIPGLDLVPEQNDVIEIPDEQQQNSIDYYNQSQKKAPDYSTISQGINNILGDEKIMNILSMVSSQNITGNNQNNFPNVSANLNQPPPNNQWGRNDNYRQQNEFNVQNAQYPPSNQQSQFNNPVHQQGNYDSNVDNYNNQGNEYGGQNAPRNVPQPLMLVNTQIRPPNMPQKHPEYPQGPNRRGPNMQENWGPYPEDPGYNEEYGMQERKKPLIPNLPQVPPRERVQEPPPVMPPVKPKWVTEPLFAPSVIVEYEHKPLRLKAREFMEPVHTFDYNHVSKDGENVNQRKFEEEADEIFSKTLRPVDKDWAREKNSKDYRDKSSRFESRNEFDVGRDVYHRRPEGRRQEARDRTNRFEDPYKEREYDRTREPRDRAGKDYERDRDYGRDRDLGREKDYYTRDRDLGMDRNRDFGRDRDRDRIYGRERDRDVGRERDRDTGRERDRDTGRERDLDRDFGRDKYRDRRDRSSHSMDREKRKRGLSKESEVSNTSSKKAKTDSARPKHLVMIDDILEHPGRDMRPAKIVIVLRGPPGSGKSYLAKLIRDREAEYGGTVRIMSIDDYFMQEGEVEEEDPATGKMVKKPLLKYEYDEHLEESYINSLKRAFKRSLTDGYFSFLIYDAVNDQLKGYADIWNFARQNGFQVYICTMELDPQVCFKRNIHNRKLEDIEVICSRFFPTPAHHIQLDATTLLQNASITDVQMEDVSNDDVVEIPDEEPELVSTAPTNPYGHRSSQWKTTYS